MVGSKIGRRDPASSVETMLVSRKGIEDERIRSCRSRPVGAVSRAMHLADASQGRGSHRWSIEMAPPHSTVREYCLWSQRSGGVGPELARMTVFESLPGGTSRDSHG